jgi:thermitase
VLRGVPLPKSWLLAAIGALLFGPSPVSAQAPYRSGEILVKLRSGLRATEARQLGTRHDASVLGAIEKRGIYRLAVPAGRSVPEMVELFARDPSCEYAEPNYLGRAGDFVPNDTWFGWQWHLNNPWSGADIDAVEGWQISRGSASTVVAVLDSGIDSDHPEFAGRILPGFDFVNDDDDPETNLAHGSEVTGLLAANADNSFAVAGVDHAAGILPVKVVSDDGYGTVFDLAEGLIFAADSGADVISMSLINFSPDSAVLNDALQYARDAGAILVACAGNGGIGDADQSSPGASPLTISVGATDSDDRRAPYSGTGSALDVVAPGSAVATVSHGFHGDAIGLLSGCSAATPIVAGIASLLLAVDDSLGHDEVRDILIQSADDQVGSPDEDTPGRDDFFGYGRVNLNGALTLAVAGLPDCRDGIDNDGDGRIDFDPVTFADPGDESTPPAGSGDPGCKNPSWFSEEPRCQDGIDNDGDGAIDYDAGLSRNGVADPAGPDPTCANPYDNRESPCGLGAELALLLPPLVWLSRRRTGGA